MSTTEDLETRCCITSVGVDGRYPALLARLVKSLTDCGFYGRVLPWNKYPPGSPTHQQLPYAFKVYAMEEAVRKGYRQVLWCDSSIWFPRHPGPIFDWIDRHGCYFCYEGFNVGEWCADSALTGLGIGRKQSFDILLMGGCMWGVDLETEVGQRVLKWMSARVRDGSFQGDWKNDKKQVSQDARVHGHRHDMPALSVIRHRLGAKYDLPGNFLYAPSPGAPPAKETVVAYWGGG